MNNATCTTLCQFPVTSPATPIKLGPSGADSWVGGCVHSRTLWVSPVNSPVRLGVSPAATSTPTGVFNQWFEALFCCAGTLGCAVCLIPQLFLPVYLCVNVGSRGLLAAAWPFPFHNLPLAGSMSHHLAVPQLPISASPTSLDECFFFISLVVGLPYSSIFCQFWVFFVFKLLLSFFWLCEEAQCVYLRLHLGWKPD